MASAEMKQIAQHFDTRNTTLFSRERATPTSYLDTNPQQFAYIHFVADGVASRTDPLDSAIILSRSSSAEDSFKLHARDTISIRFMPTLSPFPPATEAARDHLPARAPSVRMGLPARGAHNVIGALWEVSDESAPELMGDLYGGLEPGLPPSAALRQAKLALLHSKNEFRKPFYWTPCRSTPVSKGPQTRRSRSDSSVISSRGHPRSNASTLQNVNRPPNWNCRGLFTVFPINPQSVGTVRPGTLGIPSCGVVPTL